MYACVSSIRESLEDWWQSSKFHCVRFWYFHHHHHCLPPKPQSLCADAKAIRILDDSSSHPLPCNTWTSNRLFSKQVFWNSGQELRGSGAWEQCQSFVKLSSHQNERVWMKRTLTGRLEKMLCEFWAENHLTLNRFFNQIYIPVVVCNLHKSGRNR